MEMIEVIIGSSLVAAIVSGLLSMIQSNIEYRNEYYKKIIEKRFESYEMIERVLYFFSTSVTDNKDNKMFHVIFGEADNPFANEYYLLVTKLSKSNIWISEKVSNELNKLNYFIIENSVNFLNIEDGKKYYKELGDIRNDILIVVKNDILKLHKIGKALKEEMKIGMNKITIPINKE